MAESTTELASFGKRVAAAQGFDVATPGVDWVAYGREARYRIGRKLGVPPPTPETRGPIAARTGRGGQPPASAPPRRAVRIGSFEFALVEGPPARNRPQRAHHRGEATTAHYRTKKPKPVSRAHRAAPHRHRHGGR
jgi:hypothetical protein